MSKYKVHDALNGGEFEQSARVQNAINLALMAHGNNAPNSERFDAAGKIDTVGDSIDRYRQRMDAKFIEQVVEHAGVRKDSLGAGAGGFPRDFEFKYSKVWEEHGQPLNYKRFPQDTSIPLGARSWTKRRRVGAGRAQFHRGGTKIPVISTALNEGQGSIAYIVASVEADFFQALSSDFAGQDQFAHDLRFARMAVESKINDAMWTGDSSLGIYGALTHPYLAKKTSATSMTASGTSADTILAALNDLVDYPLVQSGSKFQVTRILAAPSIHRVLHQRARSTTSDTTIAEYFLKGQDSGGVKEIEMCRELEAAGPNGEHGILCFRGDTDALAAKLVQAPTVLPIFQKDAVTQQSVVFAAVGGVDMVDVGNNILGFFPAS